MEPIGTIISIAVLIFCIIFCIILSGVIFVYWIRNHKLFSSRIKQEAATIDTMVFSVLAIGGVASFICLVM